MLTYHVVHGVLFKKIVEKKIIELISLILDFSKSAQKLEYYFRVVSVETSRLIWKIQNLGRWLKRIPQVVWNIFYNVSRNGYFLRVFYDFKFHFPHFQILCSFFLYLIIYSYMNKYNIINKMLLITIDFRIILKNFICQTAIFNNILKYTNIGMHLQFKSS